MRVPFHDHTDQAMTVAQGVIEAYRGTDNAPEPRAP